MILLRELPCSARVGLSALLFVIAGGLCASLAHVVAQHENRDERPGVSLTDLEGAYHGVQSTAPLWTAIESGHPAELGPEDRAVLLAWLGGKRISEDYDSLELGDSAPAEILARSCMECHARAAVAKDHADARVALDTWEDVSKIAFSKRIDPLPTRVLAASTHAHALALAPLSIVLAALVFATRFGARWGGALCALSGIALLVDLGSWWLARHAGGMGAVIAVAGACYALATATSVVLTLADLWLPRRKTGA